MLFLKSALFALLYRAASSFTHCTKNHIFFFQMFLKDRLSKKIALEYDLPCIIRKDAIFFPKNMILFFKQKMKDDISQKNACKYDMFFKCSEKMAFQKKSHWNMIFLVLSVKIFFSTRKYDTFSFVKKSKTIISWENALKSN